ncbi:arginase family protein [Alkaliphilus sp. B6464]|nr:arginase family protein [Alkaliphilus sp. B6464]
MNGFSGSNVTILGYQQETEINKDVTMHSLWEIREKGIELIAKKVLDSIPEDSSILIHLDLDAIAKKEMYAVYSPSEEGLSIEEVKTLLREILTDSRVIGIEITEFFGLYDIDGSQALKLIELVADAIRN